MLQAAGSAIHGSEEMLRQREQRLSLRALITNMSKKRLMVAHMYDRSEECPDRGMFRKRNRADDIAN